MTTTDAIADQIVEATIAMAAESGWESVRLRLVAERLGIPMTEVLARFRDLDAVADAWFARAWQAMLAPPPPDFAQRPAGERLEFVAARWFDALAPQRRVALEILWAKLYPSHPHHWVPLIFNLSRTVHWLRDVAGLDAGGVRRQAEEIWLTGVFLAALAVWACDGSEGQRRTHDFLAGRLRRY